MKETVKLVAGLMAVSAKTAPKAKGEDFLEIKVLEDKELDVLADAMIEFGKESGKINFDRDGENIRRSQAVFLISLNKPRVAGLNCGACGFPQCSQLEVKKGPEFEGGLCAWRLIDLGIAIGSAVKTASILNVDNRIMYRIGVVAKRLGLISGEIVVGIPLSVTGKNIYFDR
ncbi:hypothetical protein H0A61_02737 [Koleobacter methoxysyntrophicus]|jgi:uncharacterized ferredoxin-like protein|uniref:DUF2148 domain-containing protein n=1 Tax=Koleobacter methoxysyntrophicus TaxID=2751313 RepID=A0A8A0RQ12_9FIRM|nr:DUF2148 domain-containing protein [Koleobacter methoxysyntrophicus]QSQ10333.1 hypothetical protein H0A61_02737 [Koleobacter methoxysyntrophicus]